MSFLEDAQKVIQKAQAQAQDVVSLHTQEEIDNWERELSLSYNNATHYEIRRALDAAIDRYGTTPDKKTFLDFMRIKLED
ncbi:MAG: hypothetical protein ILP11_04205 [Alphaproteobacteria bacterium]|nr:hypothetical protein [Alphaproteobacteria bacterium]